MSDKAPEVPTKVQPDLFSNPPEVEPSKPVPIKSVIYDPMRPPGQIPSSGWDPLGTEEFHGPTSD
jgi:hypothetical protein